MTDHGLRIGLTGGIGSGKSTVAAMLADLGAAVIDSDALSRASTASGGTAIAAIAEAFGPEFIDPAGALDRERMRGLVFREPAARARLESIVHPIVQAAMAQQEQAARTKGCGVVVLDIPLLIESGHWTNALDAVVVVDCTNSTQLARVMQRSAMAPAQVQDIIASQATRLQRRRVADAVLWNDGSSLPELGAAVAALAKTFGL